MKKFLVGVFAIAVLGMATHTPQDTKAAGRDVILLHGWTRNASDWNTAKTQYEAAGFRVHALNLPANGQRSGDVDINANYVEEYISDNHLTNVQVDGHSLGGYLVYELIRVRKNPAITSAVTRDSAVHGPAMTGIYCIEGLGVPDQCNGAERQQILSAPLATVPILNLGSAQYTSTSLPDVDCTKTYNLDHLAFSSNSQVTAAAIQWAKGENPCASVATPTRTATPAPTATPTPSSTCSSWMRFFGLC